MALPSTGIITAAMVNTELNRASNAPINLNDPAVRALAQKPSGEISFADLRGKSAEVVLYAPLGNGEAYCSNIFNNHQAGLWTSDQKKKLIVNGDRNSLRINSQFGGEFTLEIVPGGYLSGGTWPEGLAIDTAVTRAPTVINNGVIRGRGGNGGQGGTGGRGGTGVWYSQSNVNDPANGSTVLNWNTASFLQENAYAWTQTQVNGSRCTVYWGCTESYDSNWKPVRSGVYFTGGYNDTVLGHADGWVYVRGEYVGNVTGDLGTNYNYYRIRRYRTQNNPNYTEGGWGGAGGAGGTGIGYGIARTDGAWGAGGTAGGTNAGAGGSGGRGGMGGDWGQTGATGAVGNTGAAGNAGGGTSGSAGAGGAGTYSIWGRNRINYSGSGQVIGGTANN